MRIGVTLDVPDIAAGAAFYGGLLGLSVVARPHPAYAILRDGDVTLGLMEKAPGTRPTPAEGPVRDYARHWTPVHLDVHVEDFDATLARLTALGGTVEARHEAPGRPPVAFCADPFGHGFCLLGPRP
jgi:catechol 2,3-dioxygenase-like lactoylglutathione lyase family enzyme